jgi:PIN domain nuclease of toxin-antitoxin system
MKRILVDTHILLWWLESDPKLRPATRRLLADPQSLLFVSAASVWEIRIKQALGRLKVPDRFDEHLGMLGFEELPVSIAHTVGLIGLPPLHQDPFDRILLAQARMERLFLLSADQELIAYGHPVIKA